MLVTFLNRQLFWIVSVNLKNTNTEGKRDHTLNLPGKKSTYQTTETSSGSSESILALSVSAAVEQAGADGSACVLAGFGVLDSVWLDALLILISLYHTEEQRRKQSEIHNTRVIKPNVVYCTIEQITTWWCSRCWPETLPSPSQTGSCRTSSPARSPLWALCRCLSSSSWPRQAPVLTPVSQG